MSGTVAVLGPGAVGGTIAVRLAAAGLRVICVARSQTASELRTRGFELETADGGVLATSPEVVEVLEQPVALLVVTTKAPDLGESLFRIDPAAVRHAVVLPLLNGLEHPARLRAALGSRVAPGSISRFEAYRVAPGRVVQVSVSGIVTAASDDIPPDELEAALSPLRAAGLDVVVAEDERAVLWEKAARLAVLAAATAASGLPVGALREEPAWRARLEEALAEACAVARADGFDLTAAAQWEIIAAMPASLTTSTARDVAAGRPSELDAISGSVQRVARHLGVPTPQLDMLVAAAAAAVAGGAG